MTVSEPLDIYPEAKFQEALVSLIKDFLSAGNRRFALLQRFGLDVAVFCEASSGATVVRFFEVKAFGGQRMGGVGFGNGRGLGPQVDLLLAPDDCLCLFGPTVRWAYADATQNPGTARYALFTCETAKKAAMRDVLRGKQNNLRVSALRPSLLNWADFCSQVKHFLLA